MKVYTEEQLRELGKWVRGKNVDEFIASLTPIELPSDEEIVEELRKKAEASWEGCHGCDDNDKNFWINGYIAGVLGNRISQIPINLPTDENIHLNSPYESNSGPDVFNSDYDIGYHNGWKAGAKYVINKIKGGQDE